MVGSQFLLQQVVKNALMPVANDGFPDIAVHSEILEDKQQMKASVSISTSDACIQDHFQFTAMSVNPCSVCSPVLQHIQILP
jgi:hypothetical protein